MSLALVRSLLAVLPLGDGLFRDASLDEALALAAKEKRIVLVDFFTAPCVPCKRLDATWRDPSVLEWAAKNCVALKVDTEKSADLAKRFGVTGHHTILLLRADGTELDRLIGFRDATIFLDEATAALAGKDSIARAKERLAGHENDPLRRGDYANALALRGRHEEALREYLWCFDHGASTRGYGAVRLSFLVGQIAKLGQHYPPALDALRERRDAAEKRFAADPAASEALSETAALNRALEEKRRTLELYERLRREQQVTADVKRVLGEDLLPLLVGESRYVEVLELFDPPEAYVERQLRLATFRPKRAPDDAEFDEGLFALVLARCAVMYEAVVGAGRTDAAERIVQRIVDARPKGATYAALIPAAGRAGAPDVARGMGERALKSLPAGEHESVRRALAQLPSPK